LIFIAFNIAKLWILSKSFCFFWFCFKIVLEKLIICMKIKIEQSVLDRISMPYNVAFVAVEGLKAKDGADKKIIELLEKITFSGVRDKFSTIEDVQNDRQVSAFEDVFKLLKIENGSSVSLKSMYELVGVKNKSLILDNPIINFYNNFVLSRGVPAGGYDLDRLVGDIDLRFSNDSDEFIQLGKQEYSGVGETVVLADEKEVLCNDWVSKQSETHKIRPVTKNVLFRIEGLGLEKAQIEIEVKHFLESLTEFFEYSFVKVEYLNAESPEVDLKLPKGIIERQERYLDSLELLTRGVSAVTVYEDVMNSLIEGKKLRIKHGVDPTTKDLHLGYAVNYEKLRQFQDRGHTIIFLIGSFTARFGDPTDKGEARTMKEKESVMELAANYIRQLGRILDIDNLEIRYNGDWFDKMSAEDMLRIMSEFTVARMLERDMFAKRIKDGKEIGLHEIVYPMLQGYDSVEIESDLTVIGTDQTFNELQARPLQSRRGQTPQNIIAMELLVGTDGKMKMSQSLGNYIGFDDAPEDKFGKIMSIPDHLIAVYYTVCTRVSSEEVEAVKAELKSGVNPRDIKLRLATEIVTIYDGAENAEKAAQHFETVFQKKELPDEIAEFKITENMTILQVMIEAKLASSSSEARRLIQQGGVRVDSEKIEAIDFELQLGTEYIVQVGKRKFLKVV
jgi:tyrosyl-tRNA synthetase